MRCPGRTVKKMSVLTNVNAWRNYSWGDTIFQYVLTTNGIKVHKESLSILGKGDKETEIFVRNGQRVKYGAHFQASDYRSIKVFPFELLLGKILKEGVFKEDANVQNGHFLDAALRGLDLIHIYPFESGTDNRVMLPNGVEPAEFAEFLEEFFRSLDVGVDGIQVEKKECRYDYMPTGLDPDRWLLCNWGGWLMAFQGPVEKAHVASFRLRCHGVEMTLDQMGNGVKRILPIAEMCFLMKHSVDGTWVFDDFGDGLHPHLTKHLVKVIQNLMSKKKHQVILTTHDTSLLDDYLWRSDEVWFCEKRVAGDTDLFALCEFKRREGRWDWQQDYLVGRFGAIPWLGSILLGEED